MSQKRVLITDRTFLVSGDPQDRYFRDFIPDGGSFGDAPIVVASRYCSRDAVIVDVGANIGISTLAFSNIAERGRVLAVEASPKNFNYLRANLEANRVTNVVALNVAFSDAIGIVQLFEDPDFMAGSRIDATATATHAKDASVSVNATTLDLEFPRHGLGRLDLLKIDVEGHERQVLDGSVKTLERHRPVCVIEFNSYALVYQQQVVPMDFLRFVESVFPRVYYYDRARGHLSHLMGREEEFLKRNSETGFVDDLVGAFGELPGVA
jgi:FkbM family methyltransferase